MKRFFALASIALIAIGAAACTREKPPVEVPTPTGVIVQAVTPAVTTAPGGVALPTTPATLPTVAVTATVPPPVVLPTTAAPGAASPTTTAPTTAAPTTGAPTTGAPTTAAPTALALSGTSATSVPTTAAPPASPVAPGQATTYTVQWGDWLNKIAGQFGVSTQAIIAANPGLNANRIYPGQVINIPAASAVVPTTTPEATPEATNTPGAVTPPPSTGPTTYTVQRGDWLYSIARKFGVSVAALRAANPNINPNFLYPGQVLNIPAGGAPGSGEPGGSTNPSSGSTYVVRPGDTLNGIALKLGKTVYSLQLANHIANPNFIYPGQTLIIP